LAPVAFGLAVDFYRQYLVHQHDTAGVLYRLPVQVLPSWVFQSRELYDIQANPATASSLSQVVLSILVPVVLAAVATFGILRYRGVWVVAAVVPTAAFLAYRSYLSTEGPIPTYSVDRTLL